LGAALLAAAACGRSRVERYDVSGTVTYGGQPIPLGQIMFQPDTSQGNSGPAGVAKIENGRFDTRASDKGTVGGPHRIIITGYDGQIDLDHELPAGAALFDEFHGTVELPQASTTLNIDVPRDNTPP
jgi:hypothetical protein